MNLSFLSLKRDDQKSASLLLQVITLHLMQVQELCIVPQVSVKKIINAVLRVVLFNQEMRLFLLIKMENLRKKFRNIKVST
jgi:hypothetical protein